MNFFRPLASYAPFRRAARTMARTGAVAVSLLVASGVGGSSQSPGEMQGVWAPDTEVLLKNLAADGLKLGYPGGIAGVTVDHATCAVTVVAPDQGLWRRSREGEPYARIDSGKIGGRCETGSALNSDPAGRRLACFMLDGPSGMSPDDGRTWRSFQQHGRGWDFGAVDWSRKEPTYILAVHHESGQELYRSADAGHSWTLLGKGFTAIGLFDSHAYVASRGDGILRSTDGGATWTKVSDVTPTGRTLRVMNNVGTWLTSQGLLISRDRGQTWQRAGNPIEAAWGPYVGRTERDLVVVARQNGQAGLWRTSDAGNTWKLAAPLPDFGKDVRFDWTPSKQWAAGWFVNFGWDWKHHRFYASTMGHQALVFRER